MNISPNVKIGCIAPNLGRIPIKNSVLEGWSARHKVEKHRGIGILGHLIRKVGLVFSLLLTPLIPLIALYNFSVSLKEKYLISYRPNSALAAIRKMKTVEETDKLHTMKKVLDSFPVLQKLTPKEGANKLTFNIEQRLSDPKVQQHKIARQLLHALSQKDSFNPQWIKALSDPEVIETLFSSDVGIYPEALTHVLALKYVDLQPYDLISLDWKEISRKVEKNTLSPQKMEKEVKKFQTSMGKLLRILKKKETSTNPSSENQALIAALRKALTNPVYQALKENPLEPSVKLLHRLSSDIWNKVPSMDAYREVGRNIISNTKIIDREAELQEQEFADKLADSYGKMEKLHYHNHGLAGHLNYAITHPRQMMGSFASEGGAARHISGLVGLDEYDSHGTLSNNPSLQGVTTWNLDNQTAKVHNCYGGSPTIGDHRIAPEFEAAIQAAENNQLAPEDLRDPNIPMMVIYNNLQNLHKEHGEGPRSRTIMLLNKKYPLSFRGTTFSKDSDLYLRKSKSEKIWNENTTPETFGQTMLQEFKRSFDPQEKGHGFYFHGSFETWEPIFTHVIQNANTYFTELKKQNQNLKPGELQGAYQEYVYSLLNATIELQSINTLIKREITNPTLMAVTACKENIDRGGMENTKYLYLQLDANEKDRFSLILGAMHSRPLSARDRLILVNRMPQVLSFMRMTTPQTFIKKQKELFLALGYPVTDLKKNYDPYLKKAPSV